MVDQAITDLTVLAGAIDNADIIEMADDPGGSPLSRSCTFTQIATNVYAQTATALTATNLTVTNEIVSSGGIDVATGNDYQINNVSVLNATTLGSAVVSSSLTSLGTIVTGTWQGTTIAVNQGGTGDTTYTNGQLLIGNTTGNTLAKTTLTEGDGIDITNGTGTITIAAEVASTTNPGISELATIAETDTGTDAGRTITPDALAGSYAGTKEITFSDAVDADTAVGDSKATVIIPASVGGMDLVSAVALVNTAGTTGTTDIQIRNVTQAADMFSTKLTIDSAETTSVTAATPVVIDTANDDVATNDVLALDIDAVSTTAAKGLVVVLEFRLP